MSITTGVTASQLQVNAFQSSPPAKHFCITHEFVQLLPELQHIPEPLGAVPGGQVPSKPGVVQLLLAKRSQVSEVVHN
jgi:hypothetical protein